MDILLSLILIILVPIEMAFILNRIRIKFNNKKSPEQQMVDLMDLIIIEEALPYHKINGIEISKEKQINNLKYIYTRYKNMRNMKPGYWDENKDSALKTLKEHIDNLKKNKEIILNKYFLLEDDLKKDKR